MLAALLALGGLAPAWAALGGKEGDLSREWAAPAAARRALRALPAYRVHTLQLADGSRIQQYAGADGGIFAVSWHTLFFPDLASLLGGAYGQYADAAQQAAKRGGLQRSFQHTQQDLVVQASGHLHVFSGFAYHPSMLPPGFDPALVGQE